MSITPRKPRAQPQQQPGEPVTMILPKSMAEAVAAFMLQSNVGLSKSEAIRRLIDRGLRT